MFEEICSGKAGLNICREIAGTKLLIDAVSFFISSDNLIDDLLRDVATVFFKFDRT